MRWIDNITLYTIKTGSRRGIMLFGLVIAGLTMFCLGMVDAPYAVLVVARFLQGVSAGGVWTLALAMTSDIFEEGTQSMLK